MLVGRHLNHWYFQDEPCAENQCLISLSLYVTEFGIGYYSFGLEHDVFCSVQNSERKGGLCRVETAPWY